MYIGVIGYLGSYINLTFTFLSLVDGVKQQYKYIETVIPIYTSFQFYSEPFGICVEDESNSNERHKKLHCIVVCKVLMVYIKIITNDCTSCETKAYLRRLQYYNHAHFKQNCVSERECNTETTYLFYRKFLIKIDIRVICTIFGKYYTEGNSLSATNCKKFLDYHYIIHNRIQLNITST